jgi:hypothetical protein
MSDSDAGQRDDSDRGQRDDSDRGQRDDSDAGQRDDSKGRERDDYDGGQLDNGNRDRRSRSHDGILKAFERLAAQLGDYRVREGSSHNAAFPEIDDRAKSEIEHIRDEVARYEPKLPERDTEFAEAKSGKKHASGS